MAVCVGEIALRIYVASRGWTSNCYVTGLVFFVPHKSAGYTLRPNLRLKSSTYNVTTNAIGLRGPDIESSETADRIRILVLGGSSVFGYLVPDGQDSCIGLERALNARLQRDGNLTVEVLNAGVPGYNIRQCRLRYEADLASLNPDIVLLYLGWNDCRHIIAEHPESLDLTPPAPSFVERTAAKSVLYGLLRYRVFPSSEARFAIPASAESKPTESGTTYFRDELKLLLQTIRHSGAEPILSTQLMAATSEDPQLRSYLGAEAQAQEANQTTGRWLTEHIRLAAKEFNIQLIDVAAEIEVTQQHLGDAIHLTAFGHEAVAKQWAEGLQSLVDEESGR